MGNDVLFGSSEITTIPETVSCMANTAEKIGMNNNFDNKSTMVSAYLEGEEIFLEEIDEMLNERVIPAAKDEKDKLMKKVLEKNKV